MIYLLAALLPPFGLLLNGQPFSAIFNLVLIMFCAIFGLVFHVLWLACGDRRPYEAGRAPAPRGAGGDPPARPAAGLPAVKPDLRHRPL
jgi:hypothetical protein